MSGGIDLTNLTRKRRVVLLCAECGESVSWPVTVDPSRRTHHDVPDSDTMRVTNDREWGPVAVTAVDSARIDINPGVKLARSCVNGHFVARVRTDPHTPPHLVEFPLDRVNLRNSGACIPADELR